MQKLVIGGVYRHFKGDNYKVLGTAIHTETGDNLVIYVSLYYPPKGSSAPGCIYARPEEMFLSPVEKEKYPDVWQEYRFQLVSDAQNNEVS